MPATQPRTEAQRSEWGASVSQEVTKPEFGAACRFRAQRAVPRPPTLGGRALPGFLYAQPPGAVLMGLPRMPGALRLVRWDGGPKYQAAATPTQRFKILPWKNQVIKEVRSREMSVVLARKPGGALETRHVANAGVSPTCKGTETQHCRELAHRGACPCAQHLLRPACAAGSVLGLFSPRAPRAQGLLRVDLCVPGMLPQFSSDLGGLPGGGSSTLRPDVEEQ